MSTADRGTARLLRNPVIAILLLSLLGAAFFIPGLGRVHLFDWDEANFAEASREMIATHNYLQVQIDYRPFYQKPPLFMWLQVLSMKALGINEFSARFVNAVCGIVTLCAVFAIGSRVYSPLFGFLWALCLLGSFLPNMFYKSGIIDPIFNLFIFLGLAGIVRALLSVRPGRRVRWYALAGFSIGLAVLAKGPVALLVTALVMFVYWASIRFRVFFSLADIAAFLAAAILATSVFFGIETVQHGTTFIREFVAYQIRLFSTGDSGHGRPFYFHFLVTLFGCFPASFFAIIAFVKRDAAGERQVLFNRMIIILFWIVLVLFSIVKTKTVLYASLTWFTVTYLAALAIYDVARGSRTFKRPLIIGLGLFGFLVSLAITLFPVILMHKEWIIPLIRDRFAVLCLSNPVRWNGAEWLLGAGYGCFIALSLFLFVKNRAVAGAVTIFGSSALCLLLFMFIFASKIEAYSQAGPIAFYESHAAQDVYVRALFKSYADLFYGRKGPSANPESYDKGWLLRGPIDKPAFFVARVTQSKQYEDTALHLIKLKEEYGFVYYRRDVPVNK
jgi:hypothetical protein